MTPRQIAMWVHEDRTRPHGLVDGPISEGGLWHRRQRDGMRMDDAPIDAVLDYISTQDSVSRYDLQSFFDHLQSSIAAETQELRQNFAANFAGGGADEGTAAQFEKVCLLLDGIVPVLRRSQAQATSAEHASELLRRHMDRLAEAVGEMEAGYGADGSELFDAVHSVAGSIMQATEIIDDEIFPALWREK